MGHANLTNLGLFFIRRLYARGKLSVTEAVAGMVEAGETVHASEGEYSEPCMLSMATEEIVAFLSARPGYIQHVCCIDPADFPVIVPVKPLTPEQQAVFDEWWRDGPGDGWDVGDDGCGGEYGILDSIQWKFAPGRRRLYPDLPLLGRVSH